MNKTGNGMEPPTSQSENGSDDDSLLSMDDDHSQSTGIAPGPAGIDDVDSQYGGKKALYAVLGSKLAVYLVLMLAAASVGTITWILTNNEETSTFEGEVSERTRVDNHGTPCSRYCKRLFVRSKRMGLTWLGSTCLGLT
jgi:hypothetical protein